MTPRSLKNTFNTLISNIHILLVLSLKLQLKRYDGQTAPQKQCNVALIVVVVVVLLPALMTLIWVLQTTPGPGAYEPCWNLRDPLRSEAEDTSFSLLFRDAT